MDNIPKVVYDVKASEPVNLIKDEKHYVGVNKSPWVIPNGAPFFANPGETIVYNDRGGELTLGRDYYLEEEFAPLVQATGRLVYTFIRLSDNVIINNEFVTLQYRTVGAYFVPRTQLEEWLNILSNGTGVIDWGLITNIPSTLPACYHAHSIKTEICDWFELTFFFTYLAKLTKVTQETSPEEVNRVLEEAYTMLVETKETRLAALSAHDGNYQAPHGPTKADLFLGNHPNFSTATLAQELAGVSNETLSTPHGVSELAKTYTFDPSGAMLQGVVPLSRYGGESYIPPNIDGSFEGMGFTAETLAIVLENDGTVIGLGNRFDGRVRGLYYYTISDYEDADKVKLRYTRYRYDHAMFIQDAANVDTIINGSGDKAILVADAVQQKYYIGTTNGTLEAIRHVYAPLDMSVIKATITADPYDFTPLMKNLAIFPMGDWVYIVSSSSRGAPDAIAEEAFASLTYKFIYRVSVDDIRAGLPLTPTPVTIDYKDLDNVQRSDGNRFQWAARTAVGDKTSKFVYGFSPPDDLKAKFNYTQNVIVTPNVNKPGFYILKLTSYYFCGNQLHNKFFNALIELSYEINPNNGTWTKIAGTAIENVNWATQTAPFVNSDKHPEWDLVSTNNDAGSLVVLGDSTLLGGCDGGSSMALKIFKAGNVNSKTELLSTNLTSLPLLRKQVINDSSTYPTPNGANPRPPLCFVGSEVFVAKDGSNDNNLQQYVKFVTGKYEVREGVTNLNWAEIYSKPLTNNIKKLNIIPSKGGAMVSTTNAGLVTYGIDCGFSTFTVGVQNKHVNLAGKDKPWPNAGGPDDIYLIDGHTFKEESDGSLSVVPVSDIRYPAAVVEQLKNLVEQPAVMNASPKVFVTVSDPQGQLSGKFGWLPVVVMVTYADPVSLARRDTIAIIEPTSTQVGITRVITGFTVVDVKHSTRPLFATGQSVNGWDDAGLSGEKERDASFISAPARCYYYLDGEIVHVHMDPSINADSNSDRVGVSGYLHILNRSVAHTINLHEFNATQVNTPQRCMVPNVGFVNALPYRSSAGGAALITDGVQKTLLSSVYPDTGWVVYFPEETQLIIRGSAYKMPAGSVDLRNVDPAPLNKTFYLYASVEDDKPIYKVSSVKLRKSAKLLAIGTLTTNNKQILTITRLQPVVIGDYLVSYTRDGGIIPVSSGLPQDEGTFKVLTLAELLP